MLHAQQTHVYILCYPHHKQKKRDIQVLPRELHTSHILLSQNFLLLIASARFVQPLFISGAAHMAGVLHTDIDCSSFCI